MNSRKFSDDELLQELRIALLEAPANEDAIRAARAAFTWRTVDIDLELLYLDAASEQAAAAVRGSDHGGPRMLAFHGERLSVEIEIDEAGITGQLTPARSGQVTLMTPDGPQETTQADEVGGFTFPPMSGPLRLDCKLGDEQFITEWVTV